MKKKTIENLLKLVEWCQEHEQIIEDLKFKGINLDLLQEDLTKDLNKSKKKITKDIVTISDNGRIYQAERGEAKRTYFEAMMCSEGSAQCRYSNIYCALEAGATFCSDED